MRKTKRRPLLIFLCDDQEAFHEKSLFYFLKDTERECRNKFFSTMKEYFSTVFSSRKNN